MSVYFVFLLSCPLIAALLYVFAHALYDPNRLLAALIASIVFYPTFLLSAAAACAVEYLGREHWHWSVSLASSWIAAMVTCMIIVFDNASLTGGAIVVPASISVAAFISSRICEDQLRQRSIG